jgi:caa(3)-type oxidase subunit IV
MSSHNIESHIKVYWNVFFALLAFTVLTVAVSYIPFEEYTFLPFSPIFWILFVGLTIACIKGYLVSAYFMHLNDESSTIYYTLLISVIFLFVLLFIPLSWRASAGSHDPNYEQYVGQDNYVIFKEPEHHEKHDDHGDH